MLNVKRSWSSRLGLGLKTEDVRDVVTDVVTEAAEADHQKLSWIFEIWQIWNML